jgi:hypothetical protein
MSGLYGDELPLGEDVTLEDAKAWLRERLDAGERCPCCKQRAQLYRRTITAEMGWVIVTAYRLHGGGPAGAWFHLPTLYPKRGDSAKLGLWGLIEEEREVIREDGGRAGWWRVTDQGARFARGEIEVPRYALQYDSRLFGFEGEDRPVTIRDALGTKFDLQALLDGRA